MIAFFDVNHELMNLTSLEILQKVKHYHPNKKKLDYFTKCYCGMKYGKVRSDAQKFEFKLFLAWP